MNHLFIYTYAHFTTGKMKDKLRLNTVTEQLNSTDHSN